MYFVEFDRGACRAYYREERHLYCIQDETCFKRPAFAFYRCSTDGEPSHSVASPFTDLSVEYGRREEAYQGEMK